MLRLKEKLFCLKQRLRQWNKSMFGDILQHFHAAEEAVKATELHGTTKWGFFFALDVVQTLLSSTQSEGLCLAPSKEKVRRVVFDMDTSSVARPNGFNPVFYQQCWEVIKHDILAAVLDFFEGTPRPKSFTVTSILLIPKVRTPTLWRDFRPIYLCKNDRNVALKLDMAKAYDTVDWDFLQAMLVQLDFPPL
ncbi:UNVERIFIED_CONTAM: hypothetical protein Scaly_1425700 [Sesamum calycinum]|uniref:Reverse transcriptase domain-containing protein n=1 Tax=Sesamum calycinum TaxID=2727403 RepID=A0AAW2PQJ7_9LAMI